MTIKTRTALFVLLTPPLLGMCVFSAQNAPINPEDALDLARKNNVECSSMRGSNGTTYWPPECRPLDVYPYATGPKDYGLEDYYPPSEIEEPTDKWVDPDGEAVCTTDYDCMIWCLEHQQLCIGEEEEPLGWEI